MVKMYGERWKHVKDLVEAGQSWTYIVRDTKAAESPLYVLKRLKNSKRLARFEKELEATRSLQHPAIVKLVDARLDLPEPFIVTEYCEGGELAKQEKYLRTLPATDVIKLFLPLCDAVAFAHNHSPTIFHRDIKPENVFLQSASGPLVLGDFGLCLIEGNERMTAAEEAVGSRYFIAPEMEGGQSDRVGKWTDVYSLGKLLHWMLSGKRFAREKHRENGNDIRVARMDYFLEHVNVILDRAIVEAPSGRFETVAELAEALKECIRLVDGRFNPLSVNDQGCRYCGRDVYRPMKRKYVGQLFGVTAMQSEAFHALQCIVCGNIQTFFLSGDIQQRDWITKQRLRSD